MTTSKPSTILATLDMAAAFRLSGPQLKAIAETGSESALVAQAELDRRNAKRKPGSVAERIVAPPVPVAEPAPVVAAVDLRAALAVAEAERDELAAALEDEFAVVGRATSERDAAVDRAADLETDLVLLRAQLTALEAEVADHPAKLAAAAVAALLRLDARLRRDVTIDPSDPSWAVLDLIATQVSLLEDKPTIVPPVTTPKPAPKRSRKAVRS